jgi:hypothetical protein
MSDGIRSTSASWNDAPAIAALLAELPEAIAAEIPVTHEQRPRGFRGMRHETATACAFFVRATHIQVEVWTFQPCSALEAAAIGSLLEELPEGRELNAWVAVRIFEQATGRQIAYFR